MIMERMCKGGGGGREASKGYTGNLCTLFSILLGNVLKILHLKNKRYLKYKKNNGAALNLTYAFVTSPTSIFSPNQCISTKTTDTKIITTALQGQSIYPRWH